MSKNLKLALTALLIGLMSGLLSSSFLHLLAWSTLFRQEHAYLIWGLPIFGLFFGFLIKKIPHQINQGVPYILEELENEKAKVSVWMTPFIFISSIGTHLFGGSAGREGVGVIMGASIAHLLPSMSEAFKNLRPYLIYGGMAAGFSSIFGTPLAAILFAFELHSFKHAGRVDLILCTVLSSFSALIIPHFIGPTHMYYLVSFSWDYMIFFYLLIATITSGVGGQIFYWGLKGYTRLISRIFPHIALKLMMGGLFVSLLIYFTNSYEFAGIGTDVISRSFTTAMTPYDFIMKCLLTVMTLAVGFKGGEVTPLFFMGATFSNSIASLLNLKNFGLSSALGMVGLFGAVTGTPLASAVMGAELFGPETGLLCFVSCLLSRLLMAKRTVYRH